MFGFKMPNTIKVNASLPLRAGRQRTQTPSGWGGLVRLLTWIRAGVVHRPPAGDRRIKHHVEYGAAGRAQCLQGESRACRSNTVQGEYRARRAKHRLRGAVHDQRGANRSPTPFQGGAAEVVHSIKKANGEVNEFDVSPQWRRSKGAPVWGPAKTSTASANPASPSAAPADTSGGTAPPAPTPLSISEPAKVRAPPPMRHSANCNCTRSLHAAAPSLHAC